MLFHKSGMMQKMKHKSIYLMSTKFAKAWQGLSVQINNLIPTSNKIILQQISAILNKINLLAN